jgi:hypothetical protein
LAIPFFVRGVEARGKEFLDFGAAINISAGGALLACRLDLPPQTRILLEVPRAPSDSVVDFAHAIRTAKARVVRVERWKGLKLLGLKFSRPLTKPQRKELA